MRISQTVDSTLVDQGFKDGDLFGRDDLARRLTVLFKGLEHGTVSILDGRWGTGKSIFARRWANHLRGEGVASIYFDAFANDYIDDPFQAVSSSFIKAASESRKTKSPVYKRFLSNAARSAKKMSATVAKVGAKVVTVGALGEAEWKALGEIKDDLSDAAGYISEEAVKSLLESQASSETTFEALRKSIAELPSLLAPNVEGKDGDSKPSLIVLIDELDRCRPDFALGVLETLKHFFYADRVHFVLVTNRDYLIQSVEKRYGLANGSAEYIQKYYDFVIHFEATADAHQGPASAVYARHAVSAILPKHVPFNDAEAIKSSLVAIATAYDLTLRQTERIITNVVLAYLAIRDQEFRPAAVICFLAAIKALRPDLYTAIKLRRFEYSEFLRWTGQGKWPEGFNIANMRTWFEYFGSAEVNLEDARFERFRGGAVGFHFNSRLDVLPFLANAILDRFGMV